MPEGHFLTLCVNFLVYVPICANELLRVSSVIHWADALLVAKTKCSGDLCCVLHKYS